MGGEINNILTSNLDVIKTQIAKVLSRMARIPLRWKRWAMDLLRVSGPLQMLQQKGTRQELDSHRSYKLLSVLTKKCFATSDQCHDDTYITNLLYDIHGYHGLHFIHISCRGTPCGTRALFISQDFRIFLRVPLLPCPPSFVELVIHTLLCVTRRLFERYTLTSHEAIPMCGLLATNFILRLAEPCFLRCHTDPHSYVLRDGPMLFMLRKKTSLSLVFR